MCQLLVGLPTVVVLGVVYESLESPIVIHVETVLEPPACSACGTSARVKDRDLVTPVDLPAFGRAARLVWHKWRWWCPERSCLMMPWTELAPAIAAPRLVLTDRAGRWVTFPGRQARAQGLGGRGESGL